MTDPTYRVVFSGSPLPGTDRDTAIANFAQLLKRTPEQVAAAFSGKPSVIKKGIAQADAEKYCRALEKAGLAVRMETEAPPAAAPAAKAAVTLSLLDENSAPAAAVAAAPEKPVIAAPKISASLALVEDDEHKEEAHAGSAPALMTCPACGHEQRKADVCERCNVVIAKFIQRQAEKKQQQNEQGNLWPDAPETDDENAAETKAEKQSFFGKLMAKFRR